MKKYILTESELRLLLQDQKCLEALQAYGVDNWESYEEAISDEEYTVTDDDLAEYAVSQEYYTDVHKPFGVENDF